MGKWSEEKNEERKKLQEAIRELEQNGRKME